MEISGHRRSEPRPEQKNPQNRRISRANRGYLAPARSIPRDIPAKSAEIKGLKVSCIFGDDPYVMPEMETLLEDFVRGNGIWVMWADSLQVSMYHGTYSSPSFYLVSVAGTALSICADRLESFSIHHPAIDDPEDPEPAYEEIVEQWFFKPSLISEQIDNKSVSFLIPRMMSFVCVELFAEPFEIRLPNGGREHNGSPSTLRFTLRGGDPGFCYDLWFRHSGPSTDSIGAFMGERPPWDCVDQLRPLAKIGA